MVGKRPPILIWNQRQVSPLRVTVATVSGLHASGLTSSSGKGCLPALPPGLRVASLRGQPLSITHCPCPCRPETLSCLHNTDRGPSGTSNHAPAPALHRARPLKWMQNSRLFTALGWKIQEARTPDPWLYSLLDSQASDCLHQSCTWKETEREGEGREA